MIRDEWQVTLSHIKCLRLRLKYEFEASLHLAKLKFEAKQDRQDSSAYENANGWAEEVRRANWGYIYIFLRSNRYRRYTCTLRKMKKETRSAHMRTFDSNNMRFDMFRANTDPAIIGEEVACPAPRSPRWYTSKAACTRIYINSTGVGVMRKRRRGGSKPRGCNSLGSALRRNMQSPRFRRKLHSCTPIRTPLASANPRTGFPFVSDCSLSLSRLNRVTVTHYIAI